jgi:hypothetical protein
MKRLNELEMEKTEKAQAALREAQKDSTRLDWLEKNAAEIDHDGPGVIIYTEEHGLGRGASNGSWPTVRAAIDAAALPKDGAK